MPHGDLHGLRNLPEAGGEKVRMNDWEIQEWHEIVLRQRNRYRNILQDILTGVPSNVGMASAYRKQTLKEIEEIVKKEFKDG